MIVLSNLNLEDLLLLRMTDKFENYSSEFLFQILSFLPLKNKIWIFEKKKKKRIICPRFCKQVSVAEKWTSSSSPAFSNSELNGGWRWRPIFSWWIYTLTFPRTLSILLTPLFYTCLCLCGWTSYFWYSTLCDSREVSFLPRPPQNIDSSQDQK